MVSVDQLSTPREQEQRFFSLALSQIDLEIRLSCRLVPLRLVLRQPTLRFLSGLFASTIGEGSVAGPRPYAAGKVTQGAHSIHNLGHEQRGRSGGLQAGDYVSGIQWSLASERASSEAGLLFFQHCEVQTVRLRMDYVPTAARVAFSTAGGQGLTCLSEAAMSGASTLAEYFSVNNVVLEFSRIRLSAVSSWADVLSAMWHAYEPQLYKQLYCCLAGLPPGRSLIRIRQSLSQLVLAPFRPLRGIVYSSSGVISALAVDSFDLVHRMLHLSSAFLEQLDGLLGYSLLPNHDGQPLSQ